MSKNGAFKGDYLLSTVFGLFASENSHRGTDTEGHTGKIVLVPKAGLEPARGYPTAPSRQRVYQFHHFGTLTQYMIDQQAAPSAGIPIDSLLQPPPHPRKLLVDP